MQTDHEELARRVETEQPSRELDAMASAIVRQLPDPDFNWAFNYPEWQGSPDGKVYLEDGGVWFTSPKFTTSVDAALSLVPGGFSDVFHLFVVAGEPDIWECDLGRNCTEARGQSKTPAQAITAAALRARALKEAK